MRKQKAFAQPKCVRDCTISLLPHLASRLCLNWNMLMVKFSDFDYKNDRNHTKFKFKAQISRCILIFILFYHYLFFTFHDDFYFSWGSASPDRTSLCVIWVGLACARATFNTGMFMIKLLPEHKIVYNSTKFFIDLASSFFCQVHQIDALNFKMC